MSVVVVCGADDGDAYAETTCRLLLISARFCGNLRLQRMLAALSLQTLSYSKLGLRSVARRRRSVRLWRMATDAMAQGHGDRLVVLTRIRIEE